jgi:hypothetical protein
LTKVGCAPRTIHEKPGSQKKRKEGDWQEVYRNLQQIEDLAKFADLVREWLRQQTT